MFGILFHPRHRDVDSQESENPHVYLEGDL